MNKKIELISQDPHRLFHLDQSDSIHDEIVPIALYHLVASNRPKHIVHLYKFPTPETFESHIRFLLSRYTPVDLSDLVCFSQGRNTLPKRPVHITIDDGLKECTNIIAPLLQKYGVPATFFLTSNFLDNKSMFFRHKVSLLIDRLITKCLPEAELLKLNETLHANFINIEEVMKYLLDVSYRRAPVLDMLAAIMNVDFASYLTETQPYLSCADVASLTSQGFTIGAHSVDHPRFTELSVAEQLEQVFQSIASIERLCGVEVSTFAFPFSDRGVLPSEIDTLHQCGVQLTFGTAGLQARTPSRHLQRIGLDGAPPAG